MEAVVIRSEHVHIPYSLCILLLTYWVSVKELRLHFNVYVIQELCLGVGDSKVIKVTFDPAYHPDAHSRTIDTKLTISYREHPHVVSVW